jgi:hypothetical protein
MLLMLVASWADWMRSVAPTQQPIQDIKMLQQLCRRGMSIAAESCLG